jgi:hypothetical protein
MDNATLTPVTQLASRFGYSASYDLTSGLTAEPAQVHHEIVLQNSKNGFLIESTIWSSKNEVLVDNVVKLEVPFPINAKLFTQNASRLKAQDKVTLTRRLGAQVRQAQDCLAEEDILDAKGAIYGLILNVMNYG